MWEILTVSFLLKKKREKKKFDIAELFYTIRIRSDSYYIDKDVIEAHGE